MRALGRAGERARAGAPEPSAVHACALVAALGHGGDAGARRNQREMRGALGAERVIRALLVVMRDDGAVLREGVWALEVLSGATNNE